MDLARVLKLPQCRPGIICLFLSLFGPSLANSSETCIETDQVACEPAAILSTAVLFDEKTPKANANMHALFYSGGILSNQLPLAPNSEAPISLETKLVTTDDNANESYQPGSELIQKAAYSLDLLALRENFYDHSHTNRKITQKCLKKYGYRGKIDGIWGDKTYFALLSYQEPDIALDESGFFDDIKNMVANFRNCDAVLDQIIE